MTVNDQFFNVLTQLVYESDEHSATTLKKMAGWPEVHLMSDKPELVDLLKAAAINPVTPEDEDGLETPLSYDIWMKTLTAYRDHPSSTKSLVHIAELAKKLIEINKHNQETIQYLNSRANHAIKQGEMKNDDD
jgi:hypothetical protein